MGTIYSFDVEHAKEYGTNEAVILYNIIFWLKKNKANSKHLHNGKHWTYNSVKAFGELFNFLSEKQIRRCLENLENKNAIIKDNFNENAYDRTLWYTLTDDLYFKYIDDSCSVKSENDLIDRIKIDLPELANGFSQKGEIHLPKKANGFPQKGECHLPKKANGFPQKGEPIPYTHTYKKTNFKPSDEKHTHINVCEIPINNNISLDELRMEAEKIIGEKLWKDHFERAMKNITIDRFIWHLENWHIHKLNAKKAGAYFIEVIKNDIEPIVPEKQYCNINKIPQRDNFDQREYSDEELEKFYANLSDETEIINK